MNLTQAKQVCQVRAMIRSVSSPLCSLPTYPLRDMTFYDLPPHPLSNNHLYIIYICTLHCILYILYIAHITLDIVTLTHAVLSLRFFMRCLAINLFNVEIQIYIICLMYFLNLVKVNKNFPKTLVFAEFKLWIL